MEKIRVLFVCRHNSARSQMAQAFLNMIAEDRFEAESAGIKPGKLNPLAVKAMQEIGVDISNKPTKSAFDLYRNGRLFDFVITVCDEATAEQCPIFPRFTRRIHWSFEDPSSPEGSEEEKLEKTRKIREEIKVRLEEFVESVGRGGGTRQ